MAGGDEAVFQKVLPVLETMGENIVLEGGPGAGQHTKMANQIAIAGALAGGVRGADLRQAGRPGPGAGL